jgi:hypothetical protein
MVGCMVSSSQSMAPAVLLAQGAEWADLDGPVDLAVDRVPRMTFDETSIYPAPPTLWG